MSSAQAEDTDLLAAARAGDGAAFRTLIGPHLRALHGIMAFTITSEGIATITGFPSPDLFERFGLPVIL